jgi:hypothetical protein
VFNVAFANQHDSGIGIDALMDALLEAECLRAINAVGLDAHVGFLHKMNPNKNI